MRTLLTYIVENLVNSTSKSYGHSLLATFQLSLVVSPIVYLYNKIFIWGFDNQDYIFIVLGAILTDWLFGTIKHLFFTRTFLFKKNALGLFIKIGLVVGGGFLFEGLSHLTREATIVETSLKIITRVIVFMYPAISAWENIYIVSGEKFPPKKWMEKLGIYKESANLKDLLGKENLKEELCNDKTETP